MILTGSLTDEVLVLTSAAIGTGSFIGMVLECTDAAFGTDTVRGGRGGRRL